MNLPSSMQAAYVNEVGATKNIIVGELPVPACGATDVLVRVQASEVNNVDLFVRSGAYRTPIPFPFVLGRDLVGTVVATGAGVSDFAAGDRVWCNSLGHDGRQGSWAEYAVVERSRLYRVPESVPDVASFVATLHGAATAYLALVREGGLGFGDAVLIEGGAGAVGSAALQLARALGAKVITTASATDRDWCLALGADLVLDYRDPDRYRRIAGQVAGGLDVWMDCSGRNHYAECLPLMRNGGRAVTMAGLGGKEAVLPVAAMYTRDISLRGFAISNASVTDLGNAARMINRLTSAGLLQARIGARFDLADARRAHEAMERRDVRGRIVLRVAA